ncbi:hypothetical protein BG004_008386 [Podila humilis]|nr:hypothetical protein BG004_008386 [Podila humilis]
MERALALGEIVECIISFLNEFNLRKALLVNKTWHSIALRYRESSLIWLDDLEPNTYTRRHTLAQLAVCRSLHFSPRSLALMRTGGSESWANLLEGLQSRENLETRRCSRRSGIATLTIDTTPIDVVGKLLPLLRFRCIAQTLTTLTIARTHNGIFPIVDILAEVPMLVQLSLGPCPHGRQSELGTLTFPKSTAPHVKNNVVALRLRYLRLRRLKYAPDEMPQLFAMMPDLVEFRAIGMARIIRPPTLSNNSSTAFIEPVVVLPTPTLAQPLLPPLPQGPGESAATSLSYKIPLAAMAQYCPGIKTFVFTGGINVAPPTELAALFQHFPNFEEWGMSAWDLSPTTFSTILSLPNVLTTLEIWHGTAAALSRIRQHGRRNNNNQGVEVGGVGHLLHRYLCNSPMLQHLRAPEYLFPIACFDIEFQQRQQQDRRQLREQRRQQRRQKRLQEQLSYGGINNRLQQGHHQLLQPEDLSEDEDDATSESIKTAFARPKLWVCRNLKTLHLAFAPHKIDDEADASPLRKMGRLEKSQMVFSYLAKVCPSLVDVNLWMAEFAFDLEGGLCFLLRLQELESLKVKTSVDRVVTPRDFSWMAVTPLITTATTTAAAGGGGGGAVTESSGAYNTQQYDSAEKEDEDEEEEHDEDENEGDEEASSALWSQPPLQALDTTEAEQEDRLMGWEQVERSLVIHHWSKRPTWPKLERLSLSCGNDYSAMNVAKKFRPEVSDQPREKINFSEDD